MGVQQPAVHRTILVVDVAGFAGRHRTNKHQRTIREGLYWSLRTAFEEVDIRWDDCANEDRGDGVMILVPPEIPKAPFTDALPSALVRAVKAHNNRQSDEAARIRIRMVLHAGEIEIDSHGVTSNSLNHAFRLLEARPLKTALERSAGVLAVITSEWFFDEVTRHCAAADPASFRQFQIEVKETVAPAWICLPDDPHGPEILTAISAAERDTQLPRDITLIVFGSGARITHGSLTSEDVGIRLDAAGQSADQVSQRILDSAGIEPDKSASPSDQVRAGGTPRDRMTVAITGVDDAQHPEELLDVLKALVGNGVRVVLGFRRDNSPSLGQAQAWHAGPSVAPIPVPASVTERIDRIAGQITELGTAQQELLHRRARVGDTITFRDYATKLRLRLTALRRAVTECDPQWTQQGLDEVEHAVARAARRVDQESRRLDRVLAERQELRGMLSADRATAVDSGLAEDLELAELYERAHRQLFLQPFDPEAAQATVRSYQQAIHYATGDLKRESR
jgi:hypothetical protein